MDDGCSYSSTLATAAVILNELAGINPEACLLEPRDFFDKALVGMTDAPEDHWPRDGDTTVAVYSTGGCIRAIMEWLECNHQEAIDWYHYNTEGAWVGSGTPTFVDES